MHLKNGTFVGFQMNTGPTFGVVSGHVPGKQLQLVKVIAPDEIKGTFKVPLENIRVLGQAHNGESNIDLLERHCPQVIRYLVRNLCNAWEV